MTCPESSTASRCPPGRAGQCSVCAFYDRHHVFALMAAETQGLMAAVASLRSHWAKPSSVRPFATPLRRYGVPIRVVGIDDRVDRRRVDMAPLRQELYKKAPTHALDVGESAVAIAVFAVGSIINRPAILSIRCVYCLPR